MFSLTALEISVKKEMTKYDGVFFVNGEGNLIVFNSSSA